MPARPRVDDELRNFGSTRATRKLTRASRTRLARSRNPAAHEEMLEREQERYNKAVMKEVLRLEAEQDLPPHLMLLSDEEDVGGDDDEADMLAEVWREYWADRRLDLEGGFDDDPDLFEEFDQDED